MQQAIYNRSTIQTTKTNKANTMGSRRANMARRIVQKWDVYGVLVLMASSAAYGVYAIAQLV